MIFRRMVLWYSIAQVLCIKLFVYLIYHLNKVTKAMPLPRGSQGFWVKTHKKVGSDPRFWKKKCGLSGSLNFPVSLYKSD